MIVSPTMDTEGPETVAVQVMGDPTAIVLGAHLTEVIVLARLVNVA